MVKILTEKELKYIKKLMKRNAENILEETERLKVWTRGLKHPMPDAERKRRQRIRKKAIIMAHDLVLVYYAGILPFKNLPKTAKELVEQIENEMMVSMQE